VACLGDATTPLMTGDRPVADQAPGLRAIALALAAETSASYSQTAIDALYVVAATITLLQQRERGQAKVGEAIVLALA